MNAIGSAARFASPAWWLRYGFALLLLGFFVHRVWTVYSDTGLFRRLGFDWALYFSRAVAIRSGETWALYDLNVLDRYLQPLVFYTANPSQPLEQWPQPYPPLFAWVLIPFTLPSPPIGFALWTGVSVVAALHLAYRVSQLLPNLGRFWLVLVILTALPVAQALALGQPTIFLGSAFAECYLSLRAGREFRGGLWLACTLLKPQYTVLMAPLLVWKRRWAAMAGFAAGATLFVAGCVLAAGLPGLLEYPSALAQLGDFRDRYAGPAVMTNWRALIVAVRPTIGHQTGVLLFTLLGAITLLCAMWACRGRWDPKEQLFSTKIAAVAAATLLVTYHSHAHGAVLLAVPFASVLADGRISRFTRSSILAVTFLPSLVLVGVTVFVRRMVIDYEEPLWIAWPPLFPLLLLICFSSLIAEVWIRSRDASRVALARADQVGDLVWG